MFRVFRGLVQLPRGGARDLTVSYRPIALSPHSRRNYIELGLCSAYFANVCPPSKRGCTTRRDEQGEEGQGRVGSNPSKVREVFVHSQHMHRGPLSSSWRLHLESFPSHRRYGHNNRVVRLAGRSSGDLERLVNFGSRTNLLKLRSKSGRPGGRGVGSLLQYPLDTLDLPRREDHCRQADRTWDRRGIDKTGRKGTGRLSAGRQGTWT